MKATPTLLCPVWDRTVEADAERPATRCTIHRVIRRGHISSGRVRTDLLPMRRYRRASTTAPLALSPADGRLSVRLHVIGEEGTVGDCEGCGIYVRLPHAPHRKVFACSTACRMKRYQHHTVERSVTTCERCDQTFTARRGAHFCSSACRQSAYRNRHLPGHDGGL